MADCDRWLAPAQDVRRIDSRALQFAPDFCTKKHYPPAHRRPQVRGALQMIHLTRTDPARNMARFYTMALQPTLFGEWALLKEWGRIGSAGRLVLCSFASEREAALAMAEHLEAKLRKGYEAV